MSGFGAVIATIPEHRRGKRSEKSKFKQFWHRLSTKQSGLYIAIIGLFVAMLSQFVETIKSSEESKDAQEKFTEQMKVATNSLAELERQSILASESLNEIERVTTRLDNHISCSVLLELDESDPTITKLRSYLDDYFNTKKFGYIDRADDNPDYIGKEVLMPGREFNKTDEKKVSKLTVYSFDLVRFLEGNPPDLGYKNIGLTLQGMEKPSLEFFFKKSQVPYVSSYRDSPIYSLRISTSSILYLERKTFDESDSTRLFYALPSKRIFVFDYCDFPRKDWEIKSSFISLHDITGGYCYIGFNEINNGGNSFNHNVWDPIDIAVHFDDYPPAFLGQCKGWNGKEIVETIIPTQEAILNGTAPDFYVIREVVSKLISP